MTFPFCETTATIFSDVDHFTVLSVPETFKLILFPADNVIFFSFSFNVAAFTDFLLNGIVNDNSKVMIKNIPSIFFRFFIRPPHIVKFFI